MTIAEKIWKVFRPKSVTEQETEQETEPLSRYLDAYVRRQYAIGWELVCEDTPIEFVDNAVGYARTLSEQQGFALPPMTWEKNWNRVI